LPTSLLPSAKTFSIRLRTEFLGERDEKLAGQARKRRLVLVRANGGFNFNSNGGGGGWDKATTRRLIGNLAFAAGLTYLSVTGQLGWVLDAIVSIWVCFYALLAYLTSVNYLTPTSVYICVLLKCIL
jgi:hypothetical protein